MSRNTLQDKVTALSDLMLSIEDDHYPSLADYVQTLRMMRDTADSALTSAVMAARDQGMSWDQVGRWLGTSRQAAWERYGKDR